MSTLLGPSPTSKLSRDANDNNGLKTTINQAVITYEAQRMDNNSKTVNWRSGKESSFIILLFYI